MADRSVVVRLRAEIAGFRRGMDEATRSTRRTRESLVDAETASGRLVQSAHRQREAWNTAGTVLASAGAAMAAGIGLAVKKYADFDKQMSLVRAVSGASAADMEKLSAAALKAGADTKYSASEAAQATGELAKVGISTADILGGALTGSLNLAAAGNLDLADAAEISGQAMKLFNLQGKDVGHIADVLAAGANKSAADVTDLAQALSQGGLVAAQTGLTLDDTVGTLSAFADNALMGSDAGTSFKTMLQRLNPQSAEAQKLMDQLGLSAYDAQGNFVGITQYAGKLQDALGKMSTEQRNAAMQTLFGSDAVRAANVLYKLGADGLRDYIEQVNDQGAAVRNAAINMDNLSGDFEQLQGSIETALIQTGSAANGVLRQMVQSATDVVNVYNDMPKALQGAALGLGGIGSAALLAGGGFLLLLPRVMETRRAFRELDRISPGLGSKIKGVAGKATAAAAAYLVLATAADALYRSMGPAAESVDQMTRNLLNLKDGGLKEINQSFADIQRGAGLISSYGVENLADAAHKLADPSLLDRLNDFGGEMLSFGSSQGSSERTKLIEQLNTMGASLGRLVSSGHAKEARESFALLLAEWEKGGGTARTLMQWMPAYSDALAAADNEQQLATGSAGPLAGSLGDVGTAAQEAENVVKDLNSALDVLFGRTFSVQEATDNYYSALNDLSAAIKENGTKLSGNSKEALGNRDALRSVATEANDVVSKMVKQGASYDEVVAKTQSLKKAYDEHARKAGITGKAVKQVDDYLDQLPGTYKAQLEANDAVTPKVDDALAALRKIQGKQATVELNYRITTSGGSPYGASAAGIGVRRQSGSGVRRASGGLVAGPGGPRDDAIPAMLSNGEFVVNAASTKRNRPLLEHLNAQKFADGGLVQRFASGGSVSSRINAQYQAAIRMPDARGVEKAADAIDRLLAAWQKTIDDADTAARRLELVRAVAKASRKDVADAKKALADFDREQARDRVKAAAARKEELLATRAKVVANRQAWAFDRMSTADQLKNITKRLTAEKAFTDEYMALAKQREQLVSSMGDKLNAMLDQQADITSRMADNQARLDDAVAAANQRLAEQTAQLKKTRTDELVKWADLTDEVAVGFAPSMSQLVKNARSQVEQFTEWMSQLAQARSRGLSEDAIALLGLDQGPQALAQLRQVNKSTADQVDDLNTLVARRTQLAAQQTNLEATQRLGRLGQDLLAAQQEAAQAIAAAQADFVDAQRQLSAEMAAIGTDQARSYTDAIAQGLTSGIPAIEAAARQVRSALAGLDAMQAKLDKAAATAAKSRTRRAAGGWVFGPGSGTSDSIDAALSNGEFVVNARDAARNAALLTAINSGRTVTAAGATAVPQVSVTSAAPQVHVYVDGQEFRGLVRVELGRAARQAQLSQRRTVRA